MAERGKYDRAAAAQKRAERAQALASELSETDPDAVDPPLTATADDLAGLIAPNPDGMTLITVDEASDEPPLTVRQPGDLPPSRPSVAPEPGAPPMSAPAVSQDQMLSLMSAMSQQNAAVLKDVLSDVINQVFAAQQAQTRAAGDRRPESYTGAFEDTVNIGQAWGRTDPKVPLPKLKCEMYLGYWDPKKKEAVPGYPFVCDEYGGMTMRERQKLNALTPGVFKMRRTSDGIEGIVRVVTKEDANGEPSELVIALPMSWLSPEHKNGIGSVEQIADALLAQSA